MPDEELSEGAQGIQNILDEMVRVITGLMEGRVSRETIVDYIHDAVEPLDHPTTAHMLIFAVLDIVAEKRKNQRND